MKFLSFLYIFLFICLMINKLYLFAALSLIFIPVAILISKYMKKKRVAVYKKKIENAKLAFSQHKKIEPFLNINKERWEVLELIPGVTRIRAKIFANDVKKKKVTSFEEFANICNIEPAYYSLIRTFIIF